MTYFEGIAVTVEIFFHSGNKEKVVYFCGEVKKKLLQKMKSF